MDTLEARNFVEPRINGDLRQDTVLWRYLDAAKLFDFFENSTLFFCRADHFSDKFEGAFTPSLRQQISDAYARGEIDYTYEQFKRRMRESVFINCWHRSQDDITIERVEYVKHWSDPKLDVSPDYARIFAYKTKAYEYEKEVRVIIDRAGQCTIPEINHSRIVVPIDATRLVRSIVIAPDAPPWFEKLVRQSALRYGVKAPVRRSKLATDPI